MKRSIFILGSIILMGILVASMVSSATQPLTPKLMSKELSMNSWVFNETHPLYVNTIKPWIEQVEQRTGGRLKINIYFGDTLTPTRLAWDALRQGTVDIAGIQPAHWPERFPLHQILGLPLNYSSGEQGTRAYYDLIKEFPAFQNELGHWKLLWLGLNDVTHIGSRHAQPIKTLEDMKGKIAANQGAWHEAIKLLGAVAQIPTMGEQYSALQRGVYDLMVENIAWYKQAHLEEVIKSLTLVGLGSGTLGYAMRRDLYESFPQDIQKVIDEVSAPKAVDMAVMFDKSEKATLDWLRKDHPKITIYKLPQQEKARWVAVMGPLNGLWVKKVTALGFPGEQILARYIQLCKKHEASEAK